MSKRGICILLALLLALALAPGALAAAYSFPRAGIRLEAQPDWTVLTPETLEENQALLAQLGADMDVVRGDYAARGALFEVYLPGGAQVSLSATRTEQTAAWRAVEYMDEAALDAFLAAYETPFYAHVDWSQESPGYLACDWSVEAAGTPVTFAGLATVCQGTLYTFTASGANLTPEALYAASEAVVAGVTYLGGDIPAEGEDASAAPSLPEPIEDDGAITPLALDETFTGVTYGDTTELRLHSLPGTDMVLYTATDQLRGRADETGTHSFRLSTRRETRYQYSITAHAEGRSATTIEIAVDRRLTPQEEEEAYRRAAKGVEAYGYASLAVAPETFAGKAITFRGRVDSFADLGGYPCALVYTVNPSTGVWAEPIWALMTQAAQLEAEDIRTFYGEIRGDSLVYTDESGEDRQAPVVICRIVSE